MIVPSIDLMEGEAVQLIGGRERELSAGDPRPLARTFGRVGEVAVIDLDAALGQGSNAGLVRELLRLAPCRVGGGIRDLETARAWLDAGAEKIIIGTAARPELLMQLPRERVIVALDADRGEVVVEGWRRGTGAGILERLEALREYAGGFLVTFVELEGRLGGTDLERVEAIVAAAGEARVTIAGGITTPEEVAALDRLGADAQVGMALYTGRMGLAEAFAAPLRSDRPDGLWPTVVCDEGGRSLGLAYSDLESLRVVIDEGRGAYRSRSRGLWVKGASSGNTQEVIDLSVDCDRDALRLRVRQRGPFCHLGTRGCFGEGRGLEALARLLEARRREAPAGSYSARLFEEAGLLEAKLREEAGELGEARGEAEVVHEAADLIYFALVAATRAGVGLEPIEAELDRRALKVSRRPGDRKDREEAK
ncbi:MAG: phosphoribosyl-ATP diphosphatase [Deltaproteobacteria bacterium]|nr:phosphoribosyl-ATP diphosphatase [Deltaproteobacteria bacterium]